MNEKPKIVYKIVDPEGNFSCGGGDPSFNKKGKTWISMGGLKNHLRLVQEYKRFSGRYGNFIRQNPYEHCKILTYKVVSENMENDFLIDGELTLTQYMETQVR